eukprot:GHRQ01031420.1.p1 GENE.GHRQ01031420.1~~GHRQ01031420.1.p1  ORF type:complete len:253 (-),score=69.53 GHRQ01031420.1:67-825(-)
MFCCFFCNSFTPGVLYVVLRLQLRETYLKKESMSNRAQTYDAIRKLLAVLDDPFTRFLEPSRLAALRRGTAGARRQLGQPLLSAVSATPEAVERGACKRTQLQLQVDVHHADKRCCSAMLTGLTAHLQHSSTFFSVPASLSPPVVSLVQVAVLRHSSLLCLLLPSGSVTGVGLEITYDGGSGKDVVVLTPAPGGPADKAGARAGDVIVSVNSTPVKGLSLYDVSDLLQGEADSQVQQDLYRATATCMWAALS